MRIGLQRVHFSLTGDCSLCGLEAYLIIDHDHKTNLVRGIICESCNILVGLFEKGKKVKNPESFAEYLQNPPLAPFRIIYSNDSRLLTLCMIYNALWNENNVTWRNLF